MHRRFRILSNQRKKAISDWKRSKSSNYSTFKDFPFLLLRVYTNLRDYWYHVEKQDFHTSEVERRFWINRYFLGVFWWFCMGFGVFGDVLQIFHRKLCSNKPRHLYSSTINGQFAIGAWLHVQSQSPSSFLFYLNHNIILSRSLTFQ